MIVKPYSPNLGAVITGIDLSKTISNSEINFIKNAFHKFQVLFFQEQVEVSPERLHTSETYIPQLRHQ